VLSVAVILQDKLTIIPSLPHLRSEDWQVFPHHGIPDLANLTLPLEHRAISQLQHKVGQFLLARRIMWRLSGSGHDCFPDTPELRFDFWCALRAHESLLGGFAERLESVAERLRFGWQVCGEGTVFVRVLDLVVRFDAAHDDFVTFRGLRGSTQGVYFVEGVRLSRVLLRFKKVRWYPLQAYFNLVAAADVVHWNQTWRGTIESRA
jgi:hypothetical protein